MSLQLALPLSMDSWHLLSPVNTTVDCFINFFKKLLNKRTKQAKNSGMQALVQIFRAKIRSN